jgi:hypothetical protein
MLNNVPESEVIRLWQRQMQRQMHLADSNGEPVEVVYPGRLNDSRGGDFKDAIVASGSECKSGQIEVHTKASGWQAHGHHRDPAYNRVVLHVALEPSSGLPARTQLQNGNSIPTVILSQLAPAAGLPGAIENGLPCREIERRWASKNISAVLDKAGDRRLAAKAFRFDLDLAHIEAGQTLYQGFAEALGYSKNKQPFKELAVQAPLNILKEMLESEDSKEKCLLQLQALLLGQAGLLPSQRSLKSDRESYCERIEKAWSDFPDSAVLPSLGWELFKVRPGNYPVRRIIALSHLLYRFRRKGWLDSLLDLVRQTPLQRVRVVMESNLIVTANGYWASHYDFGRSNTAISPVLLGQSRVSEIAVNVLLPFVISWSRIAAQLSLSRKVTGVYHQYPRLEVNSLEQHMLGQLALSPHLVNSARRQQGLIHIYQNFCTQGKCRECDFAE